MKKLFLLILTVIIFYCDNNVTINQPPKTPDIVITVDSKEPSSNHIVFALYNGSATYFYDGTDLIQWKTGMSAYAGNSKISNIDILYTLNEYGQTISSVQLPKPAYKIAISGTDIWTFEYLTPSESVLLGGSNNDHTRIWKNNVEQTGWDNNNYKLISATTSLSGDVVELQKPLTYRSCTTAYTNIRWSNDIIIYSYDYLSKTAALNDGSNHVISWTTNYLNKNPEWIAANGKYYSTNGYEWTGSTFAENANSIYGFNLYPYPVSEVPFTESPTVGFAGKRTENSEEVLYLIEYNSGWILRYIPSIDLLQQKYRIYTGDGKKATGMSYQDIVKPVIVGDILFFTNSGSIWSLHLDSGITNLFYAGTGEIWVF